MNLLSVILTTWALVGKAPSADFTSARILDVQLPTYVDEKNPVQISVKAEFPNACSRFGPTSVRLDSDRNVVLFHTSVFQTQADCPKNSTVGAQMVDIGRLPEGSYEIRELKSLKKWGKIHVEHFEASADASSKLALPSHSR